MVQRARKGRGGTEPASTNNQVLPTLSGPRWRGSPKPRLPGPRQAAWVWQGGVRGAEKMKRCARLAEVGLGVGNCSAQKSLSAMPTLEGAARSSHPRTLLDGTGPGLTSNCLQLHPLSS